MAALRLTNPMTGADEGTVDISPRAVDNSPTDGRKVDERGPAEGLSSKPLIVVGSPKNATTDPKTGLRFYTWQERRLPSVTSIRRLAGLPHGLHQWAIGKVVEAALERSFEIAARTAANDPADLTLLRHDLRLAATAERDAAAALGTAVHAAAADGKSIAEVPPDVVPRLRQYQDWLVVSRAEILATEFQCWNLGAGYAGTADLLVRFPDGSIWVVDLKTGKGVYGEHALQLLAYLMAEFVGTDDVVDPVVTDLLKQATGLAVLHLGADSWEFHSLRADGETWAAFRGLLAFGGWMQDHGGIETVTVASRKGSAA